MRYGLPYQGSKNDIAMWVIDHLPPADVLIDAFAGGCAVTHAALLSHKFKRVIANDINDAPQLFVDAINGKYRDETRWISREDFFRLKDTDPYVRYCWSFANNGKNYLYGSPLEPYKKAYHYAAVFQDYSLFDNLGIVIPDYLRGGAKMTCRQRRLKLRAWMRDNMEYLESTVGDITCLENLQRLENLQSLQNLENLQSLQNLENLQSDYQTINLPTDHSCIVYCDPPYANTNCGLYAGFDHDRFYNWLRHLDHPAVISEYNMPDDFIEIDRCTKVVKSASIGALKGCERLFVHASQYDKLPKTTLF